MWVRLSPQLTLLERMKKKQELLPKCKKRVPGSGFGLLSLTAAVMTTALYDHGKNLRVAHVILHLATLPTTAGSVRSIRGHSGHVTTHAEVIVAPRPVLLTRTSPGVTIGGGIDMTVTTIVPLTGTIGTQARTTRAIATEGAAAIRSAAMKKGADERTARGVIGAAGAEMSPIAALIVPCELGGRLTDRVRSTRALTCPKAGVR